jgi:hypothetical protein
MIVYKALKFDNKSDSPDFIIAKEKTCPWYMLQLRDELQFNRSSTGSSLLFQHSKKIVFGSWNENPRHSRH